TDTVSPRKYRAVEFDIVGDHLYFVPRQLLEIIHIFATDPTILAFIKISATKSDKPRIPDIFGHAHVFKRIRLTVVVRLKIHVQALKHCPRNPRYSSALRSPSFRVRIRPRID